ILIHLVGRSDGESRLVFKVIRAPVPELFAIEGRVPDRRGRASNLMTALAVRAYALAAEAHRRVTPVAEAQIGMMASGAGLVVVAGEHGIEVKQRPRSIFFCVVWLLARSFISGNARRTPPLPGLPLVNQAGGMSGVNGIIPITMTAAVIRPSSATNSISHRLNLPAPLRVTEDRAGAIDEFGILPALSIFKSPLRASL